jgi:hypothetical protein
MALIQRLHPPQQLAGLVHACIQSGSTLHGMTEHGGSAGERSVGGSGSIVADLVLTRETSRSRDSE